MHKVTVKGGKKSFIHKLFWFFADDLVWVFDKDSDTTTMTGTLGVMGKLFFYAASRLNPFSSMIFTIVKLSDREKAKKKKKAKDKKDV